MSRILLVEPDAVLANTYRKALEENGHQVTTAHSAQSAIVGADKHTPDLVILELQLSGHSGIEFLYEFRSYQDWQAVPVLIQTQVPPSEFNSNWQILRNELGVANYLYKPHTSLKHLTNSVNELNSVQSSPTSY
jgi:DNA-binding response OmpR family regulator